MLHLTQRASGPIKSLQKKAVREDCLNKWTIYINVTREYIREIDIVWLKDCAKIKYRKGSDFEIQLAHPYKILVKIVPIQS